jgi:glycosyltransferase involved in cell wall biosynthesis
LRVVAIIAAFNEADVIASVVGDLIAQGVQVYFLDDASTDGTSAAVEPCLGRGVIAIERLTPAGGEFDWERILRRKTELARDYDADR